MKTRSSLIIAALLASTFAGCYKHPPKATATPQTVSFAGFTNGYVGVIAPLFATFTTNNAAAIQQWLADGTNSAIFTITNHQSCDIFIFPIASIHNAGAQPVYTQTPVLNAPTFSGIRLKPGQASTIQIAVFSRQTPWRMTVGYTRTDQHLGFAGFIEGLRSLIFRQPIVARTYTIESDLIDQSP